MIRTTILVALLAGCSLVFQDRLSGGLKNYEPADVPQCSTSGLLPAVDGTLALFSAIGVAYSLSDDQLASEDRSKYLLGGVLDVLLFGVSAAAGGGWVSDCEKAHRKHKRWLARREQAEERARRRDAAIDKEIATKRAEAVQPRGFYCASSPSSAEVGTCDRDKIQCNATRATLASAVIDVTECTLVETAWCFNDGTSCAPTEEACAAQHMNATDVTGDCEETK